MATIQQVITKLTETIELLKTIKIAPEEKKEELQVGDVIRYNGADHAGDVPPKDTISVVKKLDGADSLSVCIIYEGNSYWCDPEDCTVLVRAKDVPKSEHSFAVGDIIRYERTETSDKTAPPTGSIGVVTSCSGTTIAEVKFPDGVCTPNPYCCSAEKCKLVMKR